MCCRRCHRFGCRLFMCVVWVCVDSIVYMVRKWNLSQPCTQPLLYRWLTTIRRHHHQSQIFPYLAVTIQCLIILAGCQIEYKDESVNFEMKRNHNPCDGTDTQRKMN